MTVQETADLEANEERVEQIVVCVLCCVRSRIIQLACVAFPSAVCLLVYVCSPSPRPLAALIVGVVPLCLFLLVLLVYPLLSSIPQSIFSSVVPSWPSLLEPSPTRRQRRTSCSQVHIAASCKLIHGRRILQAKKQERKVACGDESGDDKSMPNPFALCIEAAKTNNAQAMQWCLLKGQSPDETDHLGRTPLHWACCTGSDDAADLLIKAGAALDLHDRVTIVNAAEEVKSKRLDGLVGRIHAASLRCILWTYQTDKDDGVKRSQYGTCMPCTACTTTSTPKP